MSLVSKTFTYTGGVQNFTVPQYITSITIKAWGAGASEAGGPGGYATGTISVVPGDTLNITVGQGGIPQSTIKTFGGGGGGGANAFDGFIGSSGGGASYLYKNASTLLLVAGGGGGGGSASPAFGTGGSGGGTTGTTSWTTGTGCSGGTGGTQVAGGSAGIAPISAGNGFIGSSFQGGSGGPTSSGGKGTGGGGGGGYFGGGGGAGQQDPNNQETGGGGGSSYLSGLLTGALTLSTPQNTSTSSTSPLLQPPNTNDPNYVPGAGVGDGNDLSGNAKPGGNGLVVLIYNQPDLITTKTVDKVRTGLNSTLIYTVTINNTGLVSVNNVLFVDTIPSGTTLQSNSLVINGVVSSLSPNPPGITIPYLNVGLSTITFKVDIGSSIPNPNPILNNATSFYKNTSTTTLGFGSNTVRTTVYSVTLTSSKIVNTTLANVGDVLTYTIPIKNTGNTTATSVVFIDTIPNGTSLVFGSFTQNGVAIGGSPNPPGVSLYNIGPNATITIAFKVKLHSPPSPNPIPNSATTVFSYTIDNTTTPNIVGSGSISTNIVTTRVDNINLDGIVKMVDKDFAKLGDVLTYTITIPNAGNVSATNVTFIDTIPTFTSFVPQSVVINNVPDITTLPTNNVLYINAGDIVPGGITTLSFKVVVSRTPNINPINNISSVYYLGGSTSNSNIVSTTVSGPFLSSSKLVNKAFADIGDVLVYTISFSNLGNATASNIVFIDTIPNGTTLIPGTFMQDLTPLSGSPNPPGVTLPNSMTPGQRSFVIFSVTITGLPSPNPISNFATAYSSFVIDPTSTSPKTDTTSTNTNIVNTTVNNANLSIVKSVNKKITHRGDTLTYFITIPNIGSTTATNVFFIDTVPNRTDLVTNTVIVNGITQPIGTNPQTGINLGTIGPGATTTISFQVIVI